MFLVASALVAAAVCVALIRSFNEHDTRSSSGCSQPVESKAPNSTRGYWTLVGVLVLFGAITGFSIGIPFLFLGVLLAVLEPFRGRRLVFWTALGAYGALVVSFASIAPWSCSSSTNNGVSSPTRCTSLIGVGYSGGPGYNPSLFPALGIGVAAAAAVVGVAVLLVLFTER